MRAWTDDHGEDGLRRKFDVYKPRDGHSFLGRGRHIDDFPKKVEYDADKRIGADGEFIIVLRPETDAEAWVALEAYAILVKDRAPKFAADIQRELRRIRLTNDQLTD